MADEMIFGIPQSTDGLDGYPARLLYGIISPVLVVFTIVQNIILLIVLNYNRFRTTPTCVQISGISVSVLVLELCQLPVLVNVYGASHTESTMTKQKEENSLRIFGYFIPHMFHTITLWQIMALSIQRCCCFLRPFRVMPYYRKSNMRKLTITIYVIGCILSVIIYVLLDHDFSPREQKMVKMFDFIISSAIPCMILTVMDIFLLIVVAKNITQRFRLISRCPRPRALAVKKSLRDCITNVLVTLTLLTEYPRLLCIVKDRYVNIPDIPLHSVILFCILVSYSLHFYVHLLLNYRIRKAIYRAIHCCVCSIKRKASRFVLSKAVNSENEEDTNVCSEGIEMGPIVRSTE